MKKFVAIKRLKPSSTETGIRPPAIAAGPSSPTNNIYAKGIDGILHHAQLRIRTKPGGYHGEYRYMYLRYRDGDKVKDLYLGKLA